jgi:hypothetical protein
MSDKSTCPGCDAYTSSVFQAFAEGLPCPHCGLDAEVAAKVEAARERKATADLGDQLLAAEQRAGRAERANRSLNAALDRIRSALNGCLCGASNDDFAARRHEPGCPMWQATP